LPAAMYRRGTLERLEPTFWKSLRVTDTSYAPFFAPGFFVVRAPLDKLYSTDPTLPRRQ
jgi:hypothetical protein